MLWVHVVHTKVVSCAMQCMCAVDVLHLVHVRVLSGVGMRYVQMSHIGLRSLSTIWVSCVGCEVCCPSEMCDVRASVGTVGIMSCGSLTFSLSVSFGVGCDVCVCGMSCMVPAGASVLGGWRGVPGVEVVFFLGEARLSVVESSEYGGVVGSVGP